MIDDVLPLEFVHLLFGVKNHTSPAAEEIEKKYMTNILNIYVSAMDVYMKANPDDKDFLKVMEPLFGGKPEDPTKIADLKKIKSKPAWQPFLDDVLDKVNNFNALMIDAQMLNLVDQELADVIDWLDAEKKNANFDVTELKKRLELELPERLNDTVKNNAAPEEKPAAVVAQEPVAAAAQPGAPNPLDTLKQLVAGQQPAPTAPAEAVVPQSQTDPARNINIVDQSLPKDSSLEQKFAPQIHLGGTKGSQPVK